MLDLQVTIQGEKVIIEGLNKLADEFPQAIIKGITRSAISIYQQAYQWLSGSGAQGTSKEVTSRTGRRYLKWQKVSVASGGYPVPVRTGWLRRMLNWLKPGESKTGEAGTVQAGPNEVIIYNAAAYGTAIHEGLGSSKKFGPRKFLTDAFEMFNRGLGLQMALSDEIQKAKAKAGL